MKTLLALCFFFPFSSFAAQVIRIVDGDTLTVLENRQRVEIRLANIDAPEKKQPFGERSRQSLAELCYGKPAEVLPEKRDRYGRMVAIVICDGIDVNRAQVARGMAWVYSNTSNKDPSLPTFEASARAQRIGLWFDRNPIPPWEFRRIHQQKRP